MKYWQARKLSSREFKRLCGIERQTFRLMVRLVKAQQKQKKKTGRPTKLIPEDQILITLQYWREYRRGSIEGNTLQGIFLHNKNICSVQLDEVREIGDNRKLPKNPVKCVRKPHESSPFPRCPP